MNLLQHIISKELRDEFIIPRKFNHWWSVSVLFPIFFYGDTANAISPDLLIIAQLALQSFPSLRFLHRNFLSPVTHRCLNSYYRAIQNEAVTSRSLRLQTAELACSLIPAALQDKPIFPSVP